MTPTEVSDPSGTGPDGLADGGNSPRPGRVRTGRGRVAPLARAVISDLSVISYLFDSSLLSLLRTDLPKAEVRTEISDAREDGSGRVRTGGRPGRACGRVGRVVPSRSVRAAARPDRPLSPFGRGRRGTAARVVVGGAEVAL